jgi:hypothetical protein
VLVPQKKKNLFYLFFFSPPVTWRNLEDTQIPFLSQHVHESIVAIRRRVVRDQALALKQFGASLIAFTREGEELPEALRAEAREEFENCSSTLPDDFRTVVAEFAGIMKQKFETQLQPQLVKGSESCTEQALEKARSWSSLHWATYKACCRRYVIFFIFSFFFLCCIKDQQKKGGGNIFVQ